MNVPDGLVNYAPVRIFAPGKWRCTRDGLWAIVDSAGTFVVQCRYNACGKPLITCTTEHPFYVHGKGWVAAQRLVAGDKIELQSGEDAYVDAVEHEKLAVPIQVYNFEVEEFHTYYVGNACVLVHNQCINPEHGNSLTTSKPADGYILKENSTNRIMKYGETTRGYARYTKKFYTSNNVYMEIVKHGTKREMHTWQHKMIQGYTWICGQRPPMNKSLW